MSAQLSLNTLLAVPLAPLAGAIVAGFFGMSSYGGNRDNVGWKLLGLDGEHHGFEPPFGYYDAEYLKGESNEA